MGISLLWRILFYGWTACEIYLAVATHTRKSGGKKQDRGSQLVMWGAIVSAIVVLVAGLTVRWTAILSLGNAFSANVAIRHAQTLYRSGLYRFVRHPSYSGLLLVFVAIAVHERNWMAGAVVLAPTKALDPGSILSKR